MQEHHKPIGPLHGVPVSLKDLFKVKGIDSTIGYASLAFKKAKTNSPLVDILLQAGAVLYCKTNIPQTMMALDSHNNIFGRVLNPLNIKLTAGGSSGGEGALIAMRGSVLGVGTDVGGSIRVPAMCNGLFGIKPSAGRVPYSDLEGGVSAGSSKISLQSCAGPIANTLRDCELFLRTVAEAQPWDFDAEVIFGNWRSQGSLVKKEEVVVGIVRRDGIVEPLPPVQNVLNDTVQALRDEGIHVVEMDITPLFSKCQSLTNSLFSAEGYNAIFDILDETGEPLSPWLQGRLRRKPSISLHQLRDLHGRREELRMEFVKIWKDSTGRQIDVFICPVAPHPVPPIDRWNGVSYTSSFVFLDFPAGVIPVRSVRKADLSVERLSPNVLGSWDKRNRELWTGFDRDVYMNSPLCVQVVAPRLQERRLLEAMTMIDEILSKQGLREKLSPRL
jgi:Asp-tRNA(Asn)/Glu-tRNA(Gln) amidotransferase A subunit family amidase